ncbi:sodium channel protein Nach isoform X1 [Ceratina calcarata]|uniref:Sodium channel protein Nach isoform X1 n=1 Tax=Ceratina calcarata TaxID=156304 RepID=A0AAJ7JEB4_9HYME|nr:sodium channel protein Nach isoform X1 [Ceratina calcarata]XP_026674762.1 sodium channel protein Nach isoform X1 [Ceratina calcarata]XP_026674763.1 sodium channel protein Nach isoform X1 [Ceratina calcarata]XP_026674764.1 sodium channel protein Nach isoform X1 [Ceratina calcarata]
MKYKYKPSLSELRNSLKLRAREYFLENSLHGIPYFVDSTRPKWERVAWFCLTVTSVIMISLIIVDILKEFRTDPTIIELDIKTSHIEIPFPDLIICAQWKHMNHSYIRKEEMRLHEQVYNWVFGKNVNITAYSSNALYEDRNNFRRTFETMMPACDSLLTNCEYKGKNVSCESVFKRMFYLGACCISTNLEPVKVTDPTYNLAFQVPDMPVEAYFLQLKNSFPIRGHEDTVTIIASPLEAEFVADITYTTPAVRYLRLEQRKCVYDDRNYACELNCFIDNVFAHCRCLPWFLSITDKTECPLRRYSCLNTVPFDVTECKCLLHCDHTSYSLKRESGESGESGSKNKSTLSLMNWPPVLYKRKIRFGYFDLLVSFGGIASLFLGYSLLTTAEFLYYFTLRTYYGAVIESSRKQYNIVTVHVVEKPRHQPQQRALRVRPKYYQYID